jgi:hypothetical protein
MRFSWPSANEYPHALAGIEQRHVLWRIDQLQCSRPLLLHNRLAQNERLPFNLCRSRLLFFNFYLRRERSRRCEC